MSWKKMIMGEAMPDKDDPKYKEQYEKDVAAGRKFAQVTKIDKAACKVQQFAINHRKAFLIIVFGFILVSFGLNIYRMSKVYSIQKEKSSQVTLQQSRDIQESTTLNKIDNGYTEKD